MNRYTQEQMNGLIQTIFDNAAYNGLVLKMFISKDSDIVTGKFGVCAEDLIVYKRFCAFRWTKINSNFPSRKVKIMMKLVRDIIFKIDKNKLPLYINDQVTGPIASWRLQNNI